MRMQPPLDVLMTEPQREAFSFMKDLQDSGALYYNDPANDQDNQMFTSGMAAMTINSSGAITSRRDTIGDSFEYVSSPSCKGQNGFHAYRRKRLRHPGYQQGTGSGLEIRKMVYWG